jgi:hypothetical protein
MSAPAARSAGPPRGERVDLVEEVAGAPGEDPRVPQEAVLAHARARSRDGFSTKRATRDTPGSTSSAGWM